jgi:hypothetical protein
MKKSAPPNWVYFRPDDIEPALAVYDQVRAFNSDPGRPDDVVIDVEPVSDVDRTMLSRREAKKLDAMTYSAEILVAPDPPPLVECTFTFPADTGTEGWPGPQASALFNSYGSAAQVDWIEGEAASVSLNADADGAHVIEFVMAVLDFHHGAPFAEWRVWAREV